VPPPYIPNYYQVAPLIFEWRRPIYRIITKWRRCFMSGAALYTELLPSGAAVL